MFSTVNVNFLHIIVSGQSSITKRPLNAATIARSGYDVMFECSMDLIGGDGLQWIRHCADDSITITLNDFVVEEFQGQYEIEGEYNLVILDPQTSDACRYECSNISVPYQTASAQLLVIGMTSS